MATADWSKRPFEKSRIDIGTVGGLTISRTAIGVVVAVVVGIVGLPFVFGDPGLQEALVQRLAIAASIFFLGGVLVGGLAPHRWAVAGLCAWTPFGMGLVMLVSKLTLHGEMPTWSAVGLLLLAPLAVAMLGGYAGRWLVGRITRR